MPSTSVILLPSPPNPKGFGWLKVWLQLWVSPFDGGYSHKLWFSKLRHPNSWNSPPKGELKMTPPTSMGSPRPIQAFLHCCAHQRLLLARGKDWRCQRYKPLHLLSLPPPQRLLWLCTLNAEGIHTTFRGGNRYSSRLPNLGPTDSPYEGCCPPLHGLRLGVHAQQVSIDGRFIY